MGPFARGFPYSEVRGCVGRNLFYGEQKQSRKTVKPSDSLHIPIFPPYGCLTSFVGSIDLLLLCRELACLCSNHLRRSQPIGASAGVTQANTESGA
jgi:hypothetical protein